MANLKIEPFELADYEDAFQLWKCSRGMGLSSADEKTEIQNFLLRNPGLSLVARDGCRLVATVLVGHDGRRGYLYHMVVDSAYQRQGLARRMAQAALDGLFRVGIQKCHILVYADNRQALDFWENTDWVRREELVVLSHSI